MKVLVPNLPSADDLLPYLRRIDASRHYTNDGPLVRELERRTGGVCVANATLGLELASRYLYPRGSLVRIPAFTFPATATALLRVGLTPVLCDVSRETWAIEDGRDCLPVAPFGVPVPSDSPLTDAASAWGNGQTGNCVYSLHATKTFGAGEGGLVCGDGDLLESVRRARNFGFGHHYANLVTHEGGTNAKMSEYHAAVALAQMERLPAIVKKLQILEARYRKNLEGDIVVQKRPIGSYAIFPVLVPDRDRVANDLRGYGIETRSWYCPTLDKHPITPKLAISGPLINAKMLGDSLLCLPFHSFLTEGQVDQVCERLRGAVHQRRELRAIA